ncbi:hypothetical protein C8A05DRAFT_47570 [Staphylotrichum tortipilum]|uniref:Apple domain-containing protein n=1 Tax=Staphylotrichum tortipilum TaxID=2831512 RepID=A0AAN6MCW3_9PEZI|nr:hypothetical protein C8A05DRAFT_47570 [Staphylotrichum longicolle]
MKLTTLLALLLPAALAAPSNPLKNILNEVMHRRIPSPIQASPTRAATAAPAACTNGLPASKQHPGGGGGYSITNYTQVTPAAAGEGWTSYAVAGGWYGDHFVSGPHVMGYTHKTEPYGPFKCQYTCNADASCSAYFVWYENVGTEDEHLNCVLFDAVIPASAFVETNGTITSGAYDKICERSS